MDRALDATMAALGGLWGSGASGLGKALSHLEAWHLGLFILGLWALARLMGPRLHGR